MLTTLRILNLAVVEDVTLEFDHGLNVLTGSTGAGKSLILGAVNLLLGKRATATMIRAEEDRAVVEAEFETAGVSGANAATTVARREVRSSGRSFAFIDGEAVPVKQLQELCSRLIEPHGQNDQFRLRDPATHAGYVDAFAGNASLLDRYGESLAAFTRADGELARFNSRIALLKEKEELLRHRIEELDRAAVREGELAELESSIRLMENSERVFEALGFAQETVDAEELGTAAAIAGAIKKLERVADMDERIASFVSLLREAELTLRDCADGVRDYLEGFEFDPATLRSKHERRTHLLDLERRYGVGADELALRRDEWAEELDGVAFEDEDRRNLEESRAAAGRSLQAAAAALSAARKKAVRTLDVAMTRELDELMIKGARFRTIIEFEPSETGPLTVKGKSAAARPDGVDVVRFVVRTNPGEAEGAVEEIASTGEISRISLALKKTIQAGPGGRGAGGSRPVLVFDELDAGVGADLGGVIAEKLLELSSNYQIICITHMPQVAAAGRRHLVVTKRSSGGRTYAGVARVDGDDRKGEIARMLGGERGSDKRMALAGELLAGREAVAAPGGVEEKKTKRQKRP